MATGEGDVWVVVVVTSLLLLWLVYVEGPRRNLEAAEGQAARPARVRRW